MLLLVASGSEADEAAVTGCRDDDDDDEEEAAAFMVVSSKKRKPEDWPGTMMTSKLIRRPLTFDLSGFVSPFEILLSDKSTKTIEVDDDDDALCVIESDHRPSPFFQTCAFVFLDSCVTLRRCLDRCVEANESRRLPMSFLSKSLTC